MTRIEIQLPNMTQEEADERIALIRELTIEAVKEHGLRFFTDKRFQGNIFLVAHKYCSHIAAIRKHIK